MSTVSSVNPGVTSLSQLLSSAGSATVTSALYTPAVQSALESASSGDLVQLSEQALQLQVASSLFTNPTSSTTGATPESLLFQALSNSTSVGASNTGSSAPSTAADATAAAALEQAYQLFGANSSSGAGYGSLSLLG